MVSRPRPPPHSPQFVKGLDREDGANRDESGHRRA
jgi:hypothetical protein